MSDNIEIKEYNDIIPTENANYNIIINNNTLLKQISLISTNISAFNNSEGEFLYNPTTKICYMTNLSTSPTKITNLINTRIVGIR